MVKPGIRYIILILAFVTSPLLAQFEAEEGFRLKTQVGLWFGPVTLLPGTALSNVVGTNLGTGLFMRLNLPNNTWRSELGISYSAYSSDGPEFLMSVPIYGALSYTLPINLPLTFQTKFGLGSNYVQNEPELKHNWLPLALLGGEVSFPAGKWVNIGLRLDYYFVFEGHVNAPEADSFERANGHFFNFGLMVNFNLDP